MTSVEEIVQPRVRKSRREIRKEQLSHFRPKPLVHPVRFWFWVPGDPKPKARGIPASGGEKAWIRDNPKNAMREAHVRDCFHEALLRHPEVERFLPLAPKGGFLTATISMLFAPPNEGWYPGYPHIKKPDYDNLSKLVWDALSGKTSGKLPLLLQDDQVITEVLCRKMFWDPTAAETIPGYPQTPGTMVDVTLHPIPRDPALLPPGELVCPSCGRDDFKTERAGKQHIGRCSG